MRGIGDSVYFEAELFTGIDEGMDVSECIEHPYFAFTPFLEGIVHDCRG